MPVKTHSKVWVEATQEVSHVFPVFQVQKGAKCLEQVPHSGQCSPAYHLVSEFPCQVLSRLPDLILGGVEGPDGWWDGLDSHSRGAVVHPPPQQRPRRGGKAGPCGAGAAEDFVRSRTFTPHLWAGRYPWRAVWRSNLSGRGSLLKLSGTRAPQSYQQPKNCTQTIPRMSGTWSRCLGDKPGFEKPPRAAIAQGAEA